MQYDRLRPAPVFVEPLRVLPVVLISLFAVVAAVDMLLVAQPPVVLSLRSSWQQLVHAGGIPTTWGNLLAAGVGVAGIAVAAAILSAFIRIAHTAPYATLAPVLVGCCTLVLGRMPVSLPVPVSVPLFAGLTTLLLIGGGNLFRRSGFFLNSAGALLASTPLALLWAGYFGGHSGQATPPPFDRNAQVFMFVLAFVSIGAPLLAIACRRPRRANWGDNADELGGQIVDLMARAEAGEARAAAAERQLRQHGGEPRLSAEDEALSMRHSPSIWMRLASWFCLAAFLAGAYFAGYVPLQKRLTTQVRLNKTQVEQHAAALNAMRERFEHERQDLEQQLAAAQGASDKAGAHNPSAPKALAAPPSAAINKAGSTAVITDNDPHTGKPGPSDAAGKTGARSGAQPLPSAGAPRPSERAGDKGRAQPAPQSKANHPATDKASDAAASGSTAAANTEKPNAAHAARAPGAKTGKHATESADHPADAKSARDSSVGVSKANDPLAGLDGM